MTQEGPTRDERRRTLMAQRKRALVDMYHRGAGCLMDRSELNGWTQEELVTAILDAQFGTQLQAREEP